MTYLGDLASQEIYKVAAFYSFSSLDNEEIEAYLEQLSCLANKYKTRGSILLALEGINGTICGSQEGVDLMIKYLQDSLSRDNLELKISWSPRQAFRRFKVRKKNEIVTMGVEGIDPTTESGTYVKPLEWNDLLDDPDTIVIDTRNDYEIGIGKFDGAINPRTDTFRDFPRWVKQNLPSIVRKKNPKKIAMFCTGGIRCEKATSLLKKEGFSNVYHLEGGILKYLEEVPEKDSRWQGECFVFDQRVSLNHQLKPGIHKMCHACGMPLSPSEINDSTYIRGVQCNYCINQFSDEDRDRFKERQKQIDELAKKIPGNKKWPNA